MQPDPLHPPAPAAGGDSAERLARSRADIARWLDGRAPRATGRPPGLPTQAARLALDAAAHRHPWALAAGAAAVGAVLAVSRPWRWLLRPGLLVAVASPLVADMATRWLQQAGSAAPASPAAADDPSAPIEPSTPF